METVLPEYVPYCLYGAQEAEVLPPELPLPPPELPPQAARSSDAPTRPTAATLLRLVMRTPIPVCPPRFWGRCSATVGRSRYCPAPNGSVHGAWAQDLCGKLIHNDCATHA